MPMVSDRQKATRQCTKKTRVRSRSCGVEDPTHAEKPGALWARENRETLPLPERRRAAGRKGNPQGESGQGVEQLHSTNERPEQAQDTEGGGRGGKAAGQGDPTAGA